MVSTLSFRVLVVCTAVGAAPLLRAAERYTVTTLAGVPPGADGSGTAADFNAPTGIAADADGNLYITDAGHHTIRKVLAAGGTATIAGRTGESGSTNGAGHAARFSNPQGIAVDVHRVVYVADTGNHSIRKIALDGTVTTLAGSLGGAYGTNDGIGTDARFHDPSGVAVDHAGNVYVADRNNHTIRRITPDGVVTTFAGLAEAAGATDGTGTAARFLGPNALVFDTTGNLYVADTGNHTIRQITPDGVVTTWAGSAGQWGTTDGVGSNARLFGPDGITIDSDGVLYVCDLTSNTLRRIAPDRTVTTLAGAAGQNGFTDGTGAAARFSGPRCAAAEPGGTVAIADTSNDSIRRVSATGMVTTIAGRPTLADGSGTAARFWQPLGVAVDSTGTVFVADSLNQAIRRIATDGNVSVLSRRMFTHGPNIAFDVVSNSSDVVYARIDGGVFRFAASGDFELLGNAGSFDRSGITIDAAGQVYAAAMTLHTIVRLAPGGTLTTIAGSPDQPGSTDGPGSLARFNAPSDVTVDAAGNLFVSDSGNHTLRKITPDGVVSTLAGSPGESGSADGTGAQARFFFPTYLAADSAGNIYVADEANCTIRKVTPSGEVTTIAGIAGETGNDDGPGSQARFGRTSTNNGAVVTYGPGGLDVGPDGRLYVADPGNDTIRLLTPRTGPVITSATNAAGTYGQAFSYTITATDIPTGYGVSGLPAGLTLNSATGAISGSPTIAGVFTVILSATDASGTGQAELALTIVPSVTLAQPAVIETIASSAASLAVTLPGGITGATFQWQVEMGGNWTDLASETAARLDLPSAQRFHAARYRVVASVNGASATSEPMTLNVSPPPPSTARLLNLSTRAQALTGSDILIPGFVVSGTANKRLLIRAVGPTLGGAPYNVPGTLDNPRLALKRLDFSTQPATHVDIDANDDWQTNANAAAITQTSADLFAFPFADDREAALLVDLAPGQYTVFADGVADATGIAIVELYDADATNVDARLINISNRGFVGTGAQVMIPGFVVSSEGAKTLLIRVVGPTLAPPPYNVPGTMADPRLQLFRKEIDGSDTLLLEQDNWGDNPDAAFTASTAIAVSAFALASGSADAAFVVTLPPGVYTVVGAAADGTSTGVVLVEVYVVP